MSISQLWPHSSARVERFVFEGDASLYRDHFGRRVVADWEGDGTALILQSDTQLQINGVLMDPHLFHPFGNFATITADSVGKADIAIVSHGQFPTECGALKSNCIVGCGFALLCAAPVKIDGSHRELWVPESAPIPFFRSAESIEPIDCIVNPSLVSRSLFRGSIDDLEAWQGVSRTVQNLSAVSNLDSTFDDGTRLLQAVASHLNGFAFNVEIPADCVGLRIRKLYDRFHGRQRARVLIDDQLVGVWYAPVQSRERRWAFSEFGVQFESKSSKTIRISIDPPAGVPLWSIGELEVFGLSLNE